MDLKEMFISISELKTNISDIVSKGLTRIILKNNMPLSVIIPYEEYLLLTEENKEARRKLISVGADIRMDNGTDMMVCAEKTTEGINKDSLAIKTYFKMKTSGDYKLLHTLFLSAPNIEQTMTFEEYKEHLNIQD